MNFLAPAETFSAIFAAITLIPILQALWRSVKNKIVSLNNIKMTHEKLEQEMRNLSAKMVDHHRDLDTQRYKNWIVRVAKNEADWNAIDTKYKTKMQKSGWFSFLERSKFSRTMEITSQNIVTLLEEGYKEEWILDEKEPEKVVKMNAPDIKEFPTLQNPLKEIIKIIEDGKYKCIGVLGMPGTGKTAILQNLNNHEKVAALFNFVIWVKVSNLSAKQMQQEIVERLKLNVTVTSPNEVASRIKKKLKDKKYLLLLDGVEKDVNFDEIGVDPNENCGKIVLTTTDKDKLVCSSMVVNRLIKVGRLKEEEGINMFKNVLEESMDEYNSDLQTLMIQAVRICDGHLLAIRMVASYFKMRDPKQWEDAFSYLRFWPELDDCPLQPLYKWLNCVSNKFEDAQKNCFYYSAIFPVESDIHTDCLLDCWTAEELYGRAESDDAEKMRVKGQKILEYLKSHCLLEECGRKGCVRMYKLIRQAALHKMSTERELKHTVQTGGSLFPDARQLKGEKCISWCRRTSPDQVSNNLIVSTLLLRENLKLGTMHGSVFDHKEALRVLILYRIGITSLPRTLSKLICLKVLYLNGCTNLVELPSEIEELKNLEVLDIRDSGVEILPSQVDKLRQLRRLLVSFTNFGIQSDARVKYNCELISRILSLEEFIIEVKSSKVLCDEMINIVTNKVTATLTRLRTLKFCFEHGEEVDVIKKVGDTLTFRVPKAHDLANIVQRINELKIFQVFIGCSISSPPEIPNFSIYKRYLRYCGGRGPGNLTINNVVANSNAIELVNHNDIQHLSEFGTANGVMDKPIILRKLRRLYMKTLPQLKSIWEGQLQQGSLPKLMTLEIRECCKIEELLRVESGNLCILPKLTKLTLVDLQNLKQICASERVPSALEELQIEKCPKLEELPLNSDKPKNLRKLILVDLSILKKICAFGWTAPALEELEIHGCAMLTELPFKEGTATRLRKLKLVDLRYLERICIAGWTAPALEELEIRGCPKLCELPFNTNNAMRLRKLTLVDMTDLKSICEFGWTTPALEELDIHGCPSLTELPFNRDGAMRLRSIKAEQNWWNALQWHDHDVRELLSALLNPR